MNSNDKVYLDLCQYTKGLSIALGFRDRLTKLHSERVLGLALSIGESCGLSERELRILGISASFHDVGKIGIPDNILLKPGALAPHELETMQRHTEIGEQIILAYDLEGAREVGLAIRQHHERFDGGGYPDRVAGESISLYSRIISIADSYDAMAVARAYHHARTHSEIMDILERETGTKHDPEIMRKFHGIIATSEFKAADARHPH